MILEKDRHMAQSASMGVEQTRIMTVDLSDRDLVESILSRGLYNDPIGSTIREWSSNALDATREALSNEPIIVSLKKENGNYMFKVQDFGTGMSEERVENVISKFLASTKRESETQLGYYGLGMQSGLSYSDTCNIETNYNGKKYFYSMYNGMDGIHFDLLSSLETEEVNGSTISVRVKYGDENTFYTKIKEQLCYFSGVFFDVQMPYQIAIDNNFKIFETPDWKYSELNQDGLLHICLDNVYYPLDYKKLGISSISTPIALNFKVTDGLEPFYNRETIKMKPATIAIIMKKLKKVADYFMTKHNEQVIEKDNIFDIWDQLNNANINVKIEGLTPILNITGLQNHTNIHVTAPSMKGITKLKLEELKHITDNGDRFCDYLSVRGELNRGSYSSRTSYYLKSYMMKELVHPSIIGSYQRKMFLLCDDKPKGVLMDWLKHKLKGENVILITKQGVVRPIGNKDDNNGYYKYLQLGSYQKKDWKQVVSEYELIENQVFNRLSKEADFPIDAKWLADRKANQKKAKNTKVSKEEIYPKYGFASSRGGCTFDNAIKIPLGDLRKTKGTCIYVNANDLISKQKASDVFLVHNSLSLYNRKKSPLFIALLADRDYKKVEANKVHNWLNFDEFMQGKSKMFSRICTAVKIKETIRAYDSIFGQEDKILTLSKNMADKMKLLQKYIQNTYCNTTDTIDTMMKLCKKKNLWDKNVIDEYNYVTLHTPKFQFLNHFGHGGRWSHGIEDKKIEIKAAFELLKYRKFKVNYNLYNVNPKV